MPDQRLGYYTARSGRLLRAFDRTAASVKDWAAARYGEAVADALRKDAREEYAKLIPEIPFITGVRARMLNAFLLITAQEVAAYKAMTKHGKSADEAWELCHQALRLGVRRIPRWKRWLSRRLMFSRLTRWLMARREREHTRGVFGDFELEYLVGDEDEFDLGVNYLQCGNYRFAVRHGAEAFAPYICMSDIALSDAMGWGLMRTRTLADGCEHCDFRFKKGAVTSISSKTPEVQDTIERIRAREG